MLPKPMAAETAPRLADSGSRVCSCWYANEMSCDVRVAGVQRIEIDGRSVLKLNSTTPPRSLDFSLVLCPPQDSAAFSSSVLLRDDSGSPELRPIVSRSLRLGY